MRAAQSFSGMAARARGHACALLQTMLWPPVVRPMAGHYTYMP